MGCIGMSLDDFCRCTPSEFSAIHEKWNEREVSMARERWEIARRGWFYTLRPYSKNLSLEKICKFPWERDAEVVALEKKPLSKEEEKKRYEEAKKRYGLK